MLLFVGDVMLGACNDPRALDALDGLGELNAGQNGVRTALQSAL